MGTIEDSWKFYSIFCGQYFSMDYRHLLERYLIVLLPVASIIVPHTSALSKMADGVSEFHILDLKKRHGVLAQTFYAKQ
ncbi:hypothetical protein CDL12_02481 [Handroanthus impetiginosus]|uniref:Uncharacterized protein n=1 Tax=Handroanthus impetiginosus TaxID=429701 RepID=A0A2G9I4W8_9LAMI|nr:hypothetical protein CDL12_02481 [Handroanthus impetiginosus]